MDQPILSLIQVFQKMLESEIKHELLMEIYKESLRRQYESNRILERTVLVGLYYLLKIGENFVEGQYGSNRIVFNDFFAVPRFQKPGKQRDLRNVMVQARTIRFTVFKWTIWFIRTIRVETSLPIQINWLTSLSACVFLFCFYPWPYVLNVSTFRRETANVFSIATHIFRNLLSKIRPLFEQILITCFKCSRASFSPSSCSEKMPWRRGCEIAIV